MNSNKKIKEVVTNTQDISNNEINYITIGKILDPHGIIGFAKIFLLTDFPERFKKLKEVFLFRDEKFLFTLKIQEIRDTHNNLLIKFDKFDTPELVKSYKGCAIKIPEDKKLVLPKDTFYLDDLIGLEVYSTQDKYLGKVISTYEATNTLIEVKTPDNKETMFPFLKEFVEKIDLENKKIVIKTIPGLFDEDFEADEK